MTHTKVLLSLIVSTALSGCAIGPGNPVFDAVALAHDRRDACQGQTVSPKRSAELGRPADYKRPEWCFAGKPYTTPGQVRIIK
jgi:hypothetical protein